MKDERDCLLLFKSHAAILCFHVLHMHSIGLCKMPNNHSNSKSNYSSNRNNTLLFTNMCEALSLLFVAVVHIALNERRNFPCYTYALFICRIVQILKCLVEILLFIRYTHRICFARHRHCRRLYCCCCSRRRYIT